MSRSRADSPLTPELPSAARRREPGTLELWQAAALAALVHLLGVAFLVWVLPHAAAAPPPQVAQLEARPPKPKPMRFRFVDIPDEPQVESPRAREASDRSRRARGARRPPQGPAPDNPDPYALGSTPQAVLTGPSVPPGAPGRQGPAGAAGETGHESPPARDRAAPPAQSEGGPSAQAGPRAAPGGESSAASSGAGGGAGRPGGLLAAVPRVSESDLLESFHNPTGESPMEIGTVSFDTAAIDWGPYARLMLQVVRRNWIERLPPAALSGLRGVAVVNFRIARDGSVSALSLVDSYGVRLKPLGGAEVTEGVRPFETTAVAAIEVSELPPLPEIFEEPDVGVTIAFYYNLRPPR